MRANGISDRPVRQYPRTFLGASKQWLGKPVPASTRWVITILTAYIVGFVLSFMG
jgi:hypothetical protein